MLASARKFLKDDGEPIPLLQVPTASFNKLMNRLLGVRIEFQRKIFDYFTALQVRSVTTLVGSEGDRSLNSMLL